MDLQAILDESDGSSVSSGGPNCSGSLGSAGDLERILREEDFSDNEDRPTSTGPSLANNLPPSLYDAAGGWTCGALPLAEEVTSLPHSTSNDSGLTGSVAAHSAEDWAVLQQILGEDDEDSDNDAGIDEWIAKESLISKNLKQSTVVQNNNSNYNHANGTAGNDVDSILNTINSDDEEDEVHIVLMKNILKPSMNDITIQSSRDIIEQREPSPAALISRTRSNEDDGDEAYLHNAETTEFVSDDNFPPLSESEQEALTDASLKYAQAYERKLLRPGLRDIVSPLHVKRRMKPRIEVGTREQKKANLKKEKSSSSFLPLTMKNNDANKNSGQKFSFSGLLESKSMSKISSRLVKQNSVHGLPTALAVNSKFIAVGFQKGVIWIFDLFEELRQRLSNEFFTMESSLRNAGAVTSIDISANGEALVAGYTNGNVVLWDVLKGSALRSVTEIHPSPITSVRFLSDRDMKVVSVDAGGLVHKFTFTKNVLWSNYAMESECLLDGTAGQILAMNVLPPLSSVDKKKATLPKHANHPFVKSLVLIALSSERSSFAVAVDPVVNVLHRWARPPLEKIRPIVEAETEETSRMPSATDLPCLSWGWALLLGGGNVVTPILARGWGHSIQLLQANFPEESSHDDEAQVFPAFGLHDEFQASAPVVALEWLGERSLVYLTVTNEFTVVDTVVMTLLERLDFSGLKLVYAEFALSRTSNQHEQKMISAPDMSTTFQNSIRTSDNRTLILCQEEVKSISILGATRRISMLEEDGEWLEALALALDHYENTIKSQEDRRRDPMGRRDLSKHPEFSPLNRTDDEEWIARLLIRYLTLAVENAPEPDASYNCETIHTSMPRVDLAQSHFQMLAGVCIEFCVVTRRFDLLFGRIFQRFHATGYTAVFFDVLEPYVVNDKLDYIAPEAMAYFVEHCKASDGVATVERCLLHMDVTIMDFDSILSLLRKNEMYSALIHVYTHGLDDFITPLDILYERIFDAADSGDVLRTQRRSGAPQNAWQRFGYKAILYLQHCFNGKTFPQDMDLKPDDRLQTLRPQLLRFLLQEKYSPSPSAKEKGGRSPVFGHRALKYPYTYALLILDAKAVLDTIRLALDAPDAVFLDSEVTYESIGGWEVETGADEDNEETKVDGNECRCPNRQRFITMLSSIILPENNVEATEVLLQPKLAVDAYLDFVSKYLLEGVVRTSKSVTFLIFSRMADRYSAAELPAVREGAQEQILELLAAMPRNSYSPEEILVLVESACINRAALLLHMEVVSSWSSTSEEQHLAADHFRRAIECYLQDEDEDFRKNVFSYVKNECAGASCFEDSSITSLKKLANPNTLRGALAAKLSDLVHLDPILCAQLIAELFIEELDDIVTLLAAEDGGVARFKFLHAIISGDLTKVDAVAGPVLNANLTMDHHQIYLGLMCKIQPDTVYQYLSTHNNYRPDECLKLCREHDIADASAYLLERMGSVSSALQLILQTLEGRLMGLKSTIRGMAPSSYENNFAGKFTLGFKGQKSPVSAKKAKEIESVKRILVVALDLCERNSGALSSGRSGHGSQLWFNVLDRLINAKSFLRLSKERPENEKIMVDILSQLLQITMQRMVSNIPLPDLVRKVTSDHSGGRLGEFREMIVSMLSTYGFEHDVCLGAVNVVHHDIQRMEKEHRRMKLEGSRVQSIMNYAIGSPILSGRGGVIRSLSTSKAKLRISSNGDASVGDTGFLLDSGKDNVGLVNVLSRLRSKRSNNKITPRETIGRATCNPSFMTVTDQLYNAGESSEAAYFGERYSGALGPAEHYGSLRTFG